MVYKIRVGYHEGGKNETELGLAQTTLARPPTKKVTHDRQPIVKNIK